MIYDYDAQNPETGEAEKWRYEMWVWYQLLVQAGGTGGICRRAN